MVATSSWRKCVKSFAEDPLPPPMPREEGTQRTHISLKRWDDRRRSREAFRVPEFWVFYNIKNPSTHKEHLCHSEVGQPSWPLEQTQHSSRCCCRTCAHTALQVTGRPCQHQHLLLHASSLTSEACSSYQTPVQRSHQRDTGGNEYVTDSIWQASVMSGPGELMMRSNTESDTKNTNGLCCPEIQPGRTLHRSREHEKLCKTLIS